jgi:hypothetical protein
MERSSRAPRLTSIACGLARALLPGGWAYFSTVTPFQKATWSLMFAAAGFGSG